MLHLILHLLLPKKRSGPSVPEKHRTIEKEAVVVECPYCRHVNLSRHVTIEESASGLHQARDWKPVNDVFQCEQCKQILESDSFENDGTGVLRCKTWICAQCQATNHALLFSCAGCKAWRA